MPKIVLFHGKPRKGKTFALGYRALVRAGKGVVVLRNYGLKHDNSADITPYGLVRLLECGRVPYKRLLSLQEAEKWLSSYRGMSDVVIAESAVISQCGKLGIDIDADCQLVGKVESALKDNADERWEADAYKLCEREVCRGVECRNIKYCKFRYYRLDLRFRDRLVRLPDAPRVFPFRFAVKYFELFDTFSVTEPIGWRNTVLAMEKTEPELLNERVNCQVELLRVHPELVGRRVSKVACESALLALGESAVFAGLVAHRLSLSP